MSRSKILIEELDMESMEDCPPTEAHQHRNLREPANLPGIIAQCQEPAVDAMDIDSKLCGVCQDALSTYQCPKCGILYCSLNCYKHQIHLKCSENFFKNEISQHLNSLSLEESSSRKSKMMKTLKKMQDMDSEVLLDSSTGSDESDLDEDEQLISRFEGHNLDDLDVDQIWELLGKSHQDKFSSLIDSSKKDTSDPMLKHAKLTSILPILEPWWLQNNKNPNKFNTPPPYIEIPPVHLPSSVHPSVGLSLLNVLFAYSITYRVLAGDIGPFKRPHALESSNLPHDMIISLAPSLLPPNHPNAMQFSTLEELFFHSFQTRHVLAELQSQGKEALALGWKDLIVFTTPSLIQDEELSAFSDVVVTVLGHIYQIFGSTGSIAKEYQRTCKLIQKKIAFLAQYHKTHSTTALYNKPPTHSRIEELICSILN
ncbi:Zinc finger HIT domain-containing protein 2 [Entomophthora muscae]|uniref:Zinc finger HIT domain-containing protein 2 n=1 Tax=Entomophthora muscae TaxID=34485 RepID=A0ACC2RPU5_9FUNG|nr:Zinc finger HIT domain-containing protein 2 [Entomophthora muscae]